MTHSVHSREEEQTTWDPEEVNGGGCVAEDRKSLKMCRPTNRMHFGKRQILHCVQGTLNGSYMHAWKIPMVCVVIHTTEWYS